MLGIIIGVMAVIATISVMNGFDVQLRERTVGAMAHATISGVGEDVRDWRHAVRVAKADPEVAGAAPYVLNFALLQGRRPAAAAVRGIVPKLDDGVTTFHAHMKAGSLASLK